MVAFFPGQEEFFAFGLADEEESGGEAVADRMAYITNRFGATEKKRQDAV